MFQYYGFWLLVVSAFCVAGERLFPWRRSQPFLRLQLGQDFFWFVFNGYLASFVFRGLMGHIEWSLRTAFSACAGYAPERFHVLSELPLWTQVLAVLVVSDFVEWFVHNSLHRWGPLWKLHRVHHSITTMDWIGNFRFHWGEILLYQSVKYLPLFLLGARWEAVLIVSVAATLIGNLNHSNLNISWGPLRYLLNSPRMHIWHHDKNPSRPAGVNFGVVFSVWDWLFGTAYMPDTGKQPEALGFRHMERTSSSLLMRFFLPWVGK